ncbi:MmcQ/YjbR family DNA-binding protein [soil metagenome]
MVDNPTVRRLALALPEVEAGDSEVSLTFSVRGKGLAWPYLARATPKGRREVVPGVLAVRCLIESKAMLIEAAPEIYFDDDHYRGYPAVLVRLATIEAAELKRLLAEAWRRTAPKALAKRVDGKA